MYKRQVEKKIDFEGPEAIAWTDEDARHVLELALRTFDEVQNPETQERSVSLRGFSWIVTPVSEGVVIAIEIPSGAVVAGPFNADVDMLTAMITRALANTQSTEQVH